MTMTHEIAARNKLIHLSILIESHPWHGDDARLLAICLETGDQAFAEKPAVAVSRLLDKIEIRATKLDKPAHALRDFYNPFSGTHWGYWATGSPVSHLCPSQLQYGTYHVIIDARVFPPDANLP